MLIPVSECILVLFKRIYFISITYFSSSQFILFFATHFFAHYCFIASLKGSWLFFLHIQFDLYLLLNVVYWKAKYSNQNRRGDVCHFISFGSHFLCSQLSIGSKYYYLRFDFPLKWKLKRKFCSRSKKEAY